MAEASQAYRHDTLCQGEEMLCRLASLRALTVPPLSNRGAQIIWKQSITYQKVLENRGLFKHSKECDKIGNCHISFSIGGIETE